MTNYYDLKGYYTSSEIKEYLIDKVSWEDRYVNGKKIVSSAMQLGTLVHQAILEPEAFTKETMYRPEGIKLNTKEGKDWKKSIKDKTVLDAKQEEIISGIIKSLERTPCKQGAFKNHPNILEFIRAETKVEQEFVDDKASLDEGFIRPVKLKCDAYWITNGILNIMDVKTCNENFFARPLSAIKRGRYDAQGAWYGVNMNRMLSTIDFIFSNLFVETAPPYRTMLVVYPTEKLRKTFFECLGAIAGIEKDRLTLAAGLEPDYRELKIINITDDQIDKGW
jgi:hypothetical protein